MGKRVSWDSTDAEGLSFEPDIKFRRKGMITLDEIMARTTEGKDGCIEWTWALNTYGYGTVRRNKRDFVVHRLVWEKIKGSIPEGMFICHTCDNPKCVNIDHLFMGTPGDNIRDCVKKGRHKSNFPHHKGEKHPSAKITSEQVLAIRCDTDSQRNIAKKHGISQGLVSHVRLNKAWQHINQKEEQA
jgi:hypothetical protein